MHAVRPPNSGHTLEPSYGEVVLFWKLFCTECIYKGTFRLSFVERFILFQCVFHWRFPLSYNSFHVYLVD